jgi:hypothetical protein
MKGIYCHKKLCLLKPILKKWIYLNNKIPKVWDNNDNPWWYG